MGASEAGVNGYAIRFNLEREGEAICMAMTQGSGDAAGTHQVEAQGHFSPEVKAALDQVLGDYNTARRDTCFDILDEPGYPYSSKWRRSVVRWPGKSG